MEKKERENIQITCINEKKKREKIYMQKKVRICIKEKNRQKSYK